MDIINIVKIVFFLLIPFIGFPVRHLYSYLFLRDKVFLDKLISLEKMKNLIQDQSIFEKLQKKTFVNIIYGFKFKDIDIPCYIIDNNINYTGAKYLFYSRNIISFEKGMPVVSERQYSVIRIKNLFSLIFFCMFAFFYYHIFDNSTFDTVFLYMIGLSIIAYACSLYFISDQFAYWNFIKFNKVKDSYIDTKLS